MFLALDQPLTEPHLQALVASADGGNRRKFAIIDKESMLQSVSRYIHVGSCMFLDRPT